MKRQPKRLHLDRDTIRKLDAAELSIPAGGVPQTERTCSCTDNPIVTCCA